MPDASAVIYLWTLTGQDQNKKQVAFTFGIEKDAFLLKVVLEKQTM